jgi:hypothetical protein
MAAGRNELTVHLKAFVHWLHTPQRNFWNIFLFFSSKKYFYRVFEPPLPRNAQKRTKKHSLQRYFGVGWFLES